MSTRRDEDLRSAAQAGATPRDEAASLGALCEALRALGIRKDFDELLDHILVCAQELIGFDNCALMLYDSPRRELAVSRVRGFPGRRDEVLGLRVPLGEGVSGRAAKQRRAVRIADVRQEPGYIRGLADCLSELAVPLIIQDRLVGVLNVESRRLDAFTERDERLLTVLGSQAALAIEASRATRGLQERMRQLHALYRISGLTWAGKTVDEVVEVALAEVSRLVPSGSAAILLLDEQRRSLVIRGAEGYAENVVGMHIPVERGVSGRCVRTGRAQHVESVEDDPDYIPGVPDASCEIALPLIVDGTVIGVLNSEAPELRGFGDDHVRTLTVIARQIAAVLESTRIQEERLRLAITDSLTGLFNRRYFQERLEAILERVRRYRERVAVLLVDLDDFKAVNDTHGHASGDRVLQRVGEVLRLSTRASDVAARLGGDEYALILLEAGPGEAGASAERLRRSIAELAVQSEEEDEIRITCSIGIACYRGEDPTDTELLTRADAALYSAKDAGGNEIVLADG